MGTMNAAATINVPAPESVGRPGEGHGRRLTAAFEALEAFPALAESRNRVLRVVREDNQSVGEVVAAVESDVSLVITVLRIANCNGQRKKGKIASIPEGVELLSPEGVETLAARTATFDFFERTPGWDVMPERFRLHAVATQAADGESALVRLADMLAHYGHAQPVNPKALLQAARACDLSTNQLREVMYELPQGTGNAKRNVDPCPLSTREVEVLKRLAEGKVYKQIAHELELSTSTVRTHLHNTYAKLGAVDRAQAVLIATEQGWI